MKNRIMAIMRTFVSLGALSALVFGATRAAGVTSTATLAGSSVSTTPAVLKIYDFVLGDWAASVPGFTITGLVPGTGVTKNIYFQNSGGVDLNITARVPVTPPAPVGGYGFSGFENLTVDITGESCDDTVETDMAALLAGDVALPCNSLAAGAAGNSGVADTPGNYTMHFDINPSAISGSQAGVGAFDINFTGTQDL